MTSKHSKLLNLIEGLSHDLALDGDDTDATLRKELAEFGLDLDEALSDISEKAQSLIAARKREKLMHARAERTSASKDVLTRVVETSREKLVALIEKLQLELPGFQLQHHQLESMPIEDLQSVIEDLEAAKKRR